MNQCVPPALHVFYGWLAYVLFNAYHLDACEWKYLGKHAYLSSWCFEIWFEWFDLRSCCLSAWEIYLKIWKTLCKAYLRYAKFLLEPYDDTSWKTIYTFAACLCIELCQIVVTLERNLCHAFMIKIHVHIIYTLLSVGVLLTAPKYQF